MALLSFLASFLFHLFICGLIPVPPSLLSGLIPKNESWGGLGTRIGSPVCKLQALLSWLGPGNEANN